MKQVLIGLMGFLAWGMFVLSPLAYADDAKGIDTKTHEGESSNFTDYLNTKIPPKEENKITLIDDPSGLKFELGGEDQSSAAAFKLPID